MTRGKIAKVADDGTIKSLKKKPWSRLTFSAELERSDNGDMRLTFERGAHRTHVNPDGSLIDTDRDPIARWTGNIEDRAILAGPTLNETAVTMVVKIEQDGRPWMRTLLGFIAESTRRVRVLKLEARA